ncbi:MAG: hypothetical protein HY903_03010 [Deltaproteobacteria bacterium]|nr:hypothetical protein [Deltaproteobacteria bacterium]
MAVTFSDKMKDWSLDRSAVFGGWNKDPSPGEIDAHELRQKGIGTFDKDMLELKENDQMAFFGALSPDARSTYLNTSPSPFAAAYRAWTPLGNLQSAEQHGGAKIVAAELVKLSGWQREFILSDAAARLTHRYEPEKVAGMRCLNDVRTAIRELQQATPYCPPGSMPR